MLSGSELYDLVSNVSVFCILSVQYYPNNLRREDSYMKFYDENKSCHYRSSQNKRFVSNCCRGIVVSEVVIVAVVN